ncbi:MAG: CotH kinase family protein, partial [Clostridia bacterium]|nr:CotH kinase family protein [Clostridia bacterium]
KTRLIEALKQLSSYENPDEVVNVDAVLRYFVVHNYVVNADSYTGSMIHNYYLYEEDGKLGWKCPNCGNTDQGKMNVARRTCGYIGSQYWNQGRTQEIKERVLHL